MGAIVGIEKIANVKIGGEKVGRRGSNGARKTNVKNTKIIKLILFLPLKIT